MACQFGIFAALIAFESDVLLWPKPSKMINTCGLRVTDFPEVVGNA